MVLSVSLAIMTLSLRALSRVFFFLSLYFCGAVLAGGEERDQYSDVFQHKVECWSAGINFVTETPVLNEDLVSVFDRQSDSATSDLVARRQNTIQLFESKWRELLPEHQRWLDDPTTPPHMRVHYKNVSFPFWNWLIQEYGYPDVELANDMRRGVPVIGPVPPSNVFGSEPPDSSRRHARDPSTFVQKKSRPPGNNEFCCEFQSHIKATLEAKRLEGKAEGPFDRNQLPEGAIFSRSFCIQQGWKEDKDGTRRAKLRDVVDARHLNEFVSRSEKLSFPSHSGLTNLIVQARIAGFKGLEYDNKVFQSDLPQDRAQFEAAIKRQRLCPPSDGPVFDRNIDLSLFVIDYKSAFHQLMVSDPDLNFVEFYDLDLKKLQYYRLHYATFGNLHSIHFWCRVSNFASFIIRKAFSVAARVYIDDMFGVENSDSIDSAMDCMLRLIALLGLSVSFEKVKKGVAVKILGLEYTISALGISVDVPAEKRQDILDGLASLQGNFTTCSYREFASVFGKLNFLAYSCRARSLKKFISPFYPYLDEDFFHKHHKRPGFSWAKQLRALRQAVEVVPPFQVKFKHVLLPKAKIFTDASISEDGQNAWIGVLAFINGAVFCVSDKVPIDVLGKIGTRKNKIMILEALAVEAVFHLFGGILRSRFVDIHVDNKAVWGAGAKGYSKNPELTDVAHSFLTLSTVLDAKPWFL